VPAFDLDRHAVVEASAGTGKTHTLEGLVRDLLRSGKARLDQILLVTFTEKATGELKGRLRESLEKARDRADGGELFQAALDQFDQAPIYTIHGFCQHVLQEYAFEHGQDFRPQLVDDGALLRRCLREIQRSHWPREYGDRLRTVLEAAGYTEKGGENWERLVLNVARRYRPAFSNRLLPEPEEELPEGLPQEELRPRFLARTVRRLQEQMVRYKRDRGLRSYDDMLVQMLEGLDPAVNPAADRLIDRLRRRFRYAVVDEFQDTDPVQWRIFKRIFVDGGNARLFIVGDPKQAIFSFRGADLPTYTNAVQEMTVGHGAATAPLKTNWRSAPELLTPLNRLFQESGWFAAGNISYQEVEPPGEDDQRNKIVRDDTERAALTLVDFTKVKRLTEARRRNAAFVAGEIGRLLGAASSGPLLEVVLKSGPPRPLEAGDIGVLVFKRAETWPLIKVFRAARIPFSCYKQAGLWQTDEVNHLDFVLRALARPEDRPAFHRALLTRFFGATPEDLVRCEDLASAHRSRRLFQQWLGLAERRAWSSLFASLLEDTGVVLREAGDVEEGERRLANFRHIIGFLEQEAYERNLDLLGILDLLNERRSVAGDENDIQPIETERSKVRIMTVHASKGLEFPVVFLAGGFTSGTANDYLTYHEGTEMIVDLRKEESARDRGRQERDQEERRLLYVALTRAMFKLYVPLAASTHGGRGPLVTILQPAVDQAQVEDLESRFVGTVTPKEKVSRADGTYQTRAIRSGSPLPVPAELFPQLDPDLKRRRIQVRSFSSLHRARATRLGEEASFVERPPRADDDVPGALDVPDPLRGPVFGDMVHNVLEGLDFASVGQASRPADLLRDGTPFRKLVDEQVKGSALKLRSRVRGEALEDACRTQIADLVWNALRTPLTAAGGPLWMIPAQDHVQEIEFHFPESSGEVPPAEVHREEGFLTGFMDMVFRKNGRFFLVDWKTNWLDTYDAEALERCMHDSDYFRQYRLYLQALQRWLEKAQGEEFDFTRDFGGVYYLFLRGMNARDETNGVYFRRSCSEDLLLESVLAGA
jgi:exodeoxyribonuclease V beta subunit